MLRGSVPGSLQARRHLRPGRSWLLKPKFLHAMLGERSLPCPAPPPRPSAGGTGRGGSPSPPTLAQGEPGCAGAAGCSVFLFLPRWGCRGFVLHPETFHEEVDDGVVQVLPEGGAVEVMAFVRVDLQGRREVMIGVPDLGVHARCGASHSRARMNLPREILTGSQRLSTRRLSRAQGPLV